jgi:hypothetical protein
MTKQMGTLTVAERVVAAAAGSRIVQVEGHCFGQLGLIVAVAI